MFVFPLQGSQRKRPRQTSRRVDRRAYELGGSVSARVGKSQHGTFKHGAVSMKNRPSAIDILETYTGLLGESD